MDRPACREKADIRREQQRYAFAWNEGTVDEGEGYERRACSADEHAANHHKGHERCSSAGCWKEENVNEHEKIKITWNEVDCADGVAQPPVGPPRPSVKALLWPLLLGGIAVILLILVGVAVARWGGSDGKAPGQTVESWIAQERPKWDGDMSNSSTVKKSIEDIHPLVTYKRAIISEMRATTIDGSNNAGRQGENISDVEILVTFYWEGPVTKDGFTEVRFIYDYQGRQLKGRRFERSNAAINLATVDWFKFGMVLGVILF